MRRTLILLLILSLAAPALAQTPPDQLCLRCDRWGGSQGGGGGGTIGDIGTQQPLVANGCYTGNATDNREIETGFRPAFVMLDEMDNENNSGCQYRTGLYADDLSCGTAGAGGVVCTSNRIMHFTDTSFVIGTGADVNGNGQPFCWFASNSVTTLTDVGLYQGDGTTSRIIETTFTPDGLMIFQHKASGSTDNDQIYLTNFDLQPNSTSVWDLNSGGFAAGHVLSLNAPTEITPPSFSVGGSGVNNAPELYDFIAWDEQRGAIDQGTFAGNNAATLTITTDCAEGVSAVFMTSDTGQPSMWRTETMLDPFVVESGTGNSFIARCGNGADRTGCLGRISGNSFNVIHSAIPATDCNKTGENYAWIAVCKGPTLASVPAFDPHTLLRAAYSFETAANTAVPNVTGTQCGSDCDMSDSNSVPRSTTEFREKLQSIDPAGVDDSLTCARATCANGTTDINIGTSASWGCWGRLEADANSRGVFYGGGTAGNNANWALLRNATNDLINCRVTTTGDSAVTAAGATNSWTINTWFAESCVFDDTANTVQAYKNAVATGSAGSVASMTSTLAADPRIAANQVLTSTAFFDGQIDACWLYAGVLTTAQMCYLASCGLDGTECLCLAAEPSLYVDTGRNVDAGSCALPACNDWSL